MPCDAFPEAMSFVGKWNECCLLWSVAHGDRRLENSARFLSSERFSSFLGETARGMPPQSPGRKEITPEILRRELGGQNQWTLSC